MIVTEILMLGLYLVAGRNIRRTIYRDSEIDSVLLSHNKARVMLRPGQETVS